MTMPSSLFSALNGTQAAPAQSPAPMLDQNFLSSFMQFKNRFAPIMNARNPAQAAQNVLAQYGISPAQFQQIVNQYAAQATNIQRQLMGR